MKMICLPLKVILGVLLLFFCETEPLYAQGNVDTIWVTHQNKENFIHYPVKAGETLFMLSKKFSVPAALITQLNHLNYSQNLQPSDLIKIPIEKYNYLNINSVVASKAIYFKVKEGERLRTVFRYFNVARSSIQRWNHLPLPEVFAGQVLQVGWVKFDNTQHPSLPEKETIAQNQRSGSKVDNNFSSKIIRSQDTVTATPDSDTAEADSTENEGSFAQQFQKDEEGRELQEASGAAVFFTTQTPDDNKVYYAFYNDAPRGTILSIFNPASRRAVYAKVIGPLPQIGKYHNALIGLSSNSAKELKGIGSRVFVKIKY